MKAKLPKNQAFSLGAVKFIQELCKPLHNKLLVHFTHDITFGKGQITMLMNSETALRFYFQHKIPAICTDESGRTFDTGIYLGKVLKEYYKDASIIMPKLPFAQSSIHICTRELDYQQLYSLYFDLPENDFLQWVVNNGNLVNDFIENYKVQVSNIVDEALLPESRTILPLFSEMINPVVEKPIQIKLIHKNTKMPIFLAAQQSNCLQHLAKGKSAKEIAQAMCLSRRTVEHYLTRIREILGCSSNRELIAAYGEQLFNIEKNEC